VYAFALLHHAAAIMVAHNHPSGDPKPSDEDREITSLLAQSGKVLGIPLVDHIVIGDGTYYSFLENEAF
jgi:DNA repair protein RadC